MASGSPGLALVRSAVRALREDAVLALLFAAIHAVVLWNAFRHDPAIAYDAWAHVEYAKVLSTLALPTPDQTYEFFAPPLSYVVPAALIRLGLAPLPAYKVSQLVEVGYSVALCLLLLASCELLWPGARRPRRTALLLLGSLPVYYRTFAFVRPEPLLTLLWGAALLAALHLFVGGRSKGVVLGLALGLLLLTRQQAAFLIVAIGAFALVRAAVGRSGWVELRALSTAAAIAFAVGGWFYLRHALVHGSPMAYATRPAPFALSNLPASFYLAPDWPLLFTHPIRPFFRNQFVPKLYAEMWGDHNCYFVIRAEDGRTGELLYGPAQEATVPAKAHKRWLHTNRFEMARYLGRLNAVALLPSALMAGGLSLGLVTLARLIAVRARRARPEASDARPESRADALLGLPALGVVVTLTGFVLLLVRYPSNTGQNIKATYILYVFPMLALLGAAALERIRARWPRAARALTAALVLVALFASRTFVTAYPAPWRDTWEPPRTPRAVTGGAASPSSASTAPAPLADSGR